MKYFVLAFLSLLLIGCKEMTTTELVDEHKDGIVLITNELPENQGGIGTGFIVNDKIITNLHVVDGQGKLLVYSDDSQRKYEATVTYKDPVSDMAVLTVKDWDSFKKNETPVNLDFGDSDTSKVGDKVVVIGHPWGLLWSVSEGIVSSKFRRVGPNPKFMDQIDAKLFQGNSGGPIFNEKGQVICVSNMMLSKEGGSYGFCVPSNLVKKVLYDFEKLGEVRWRVLNIAANLTDDGSAVVVKTIEANGAAAAAGLKEGDKLLEIYTPNSHPNGVRLTDPNDLITELAQLKGDNEIVKLLIERNDEKLMIDVKTNHKLSSEYTVN